DRDDAGGGDDDEPAQRQADGTDTHGERQAKREPTAPPAPSATRHAEPEQVELVARVERSETREHPLNAAPPPPGFAGAQPGLQRSSPQRSSSAAPRTLSAPQPENAAALPAGRTLPSGSGSGQRRG